MDTSKQNRIFYYDNLRFFLIAAVVIGHFVEVVLSQSVMYKSIFLWIYAFHMPMFLYLSGMFHKNDKVLPKVMRFVMIGFALKIFRFLEALILNGHATISYFKQGGLPWFMFVLAGYTLLSYILRKFDKRYILIFAIILGLFSGYDSSLGDLFYASRFIVFYPFFVLGEMTSPDMMLKTVQKKWVRLIGILAIAVWTAICVFKLDSVYILRLLFSGRNPFGDNFGEWAFLYRGLCYVITVIVGFGVMCLIPKKRIPIVSLFGSRTMQVYFWHYTFLSVLLYFHVDAALCTNRIGKLVWLLIAVAVTFITSIKIFGFPTNQIVNACRYVKNRNAE